MQPLFISGRVLEEGGASPTEPVVIERVCNGVARRQGYTDAHGSFQLQLDQNIGFQDASETTSASIFGTDAQPGRQYQDPKLRYQGCEIRAVLPGFQSGSVLLKLQENSWQFDVGTIFIKRMDKAQGTTVSMTSLSAPGDARHAYEKAQKAFAQEKLDSAEKELNKAVKAYPNYAVAWSLLGDVHQRQKQLEEAKNDYTRARSADPQFVNPSFGLALIAMQEKNWQEAAQYTQQVAKLNSVAFPSAYFYNAVANYNLGKFGPAEESGRKFKAMDTEHHHPQVCLLLSDVFIRKQDYSNAAQELRDYLTIAPGAPDAETVKEKLQRLEQAKVAKQQ
jgi:tetratricopeptide (TPR) repeat protein